MLKTMSDRIVAIPMVDCFVRKNGKYLMLKRHASKKILPNIWIAPGGKLEKNEGLYAACKREIREETGLEIKNLRLKAIGNAYNKDFNTEIFFHLFVADWKSGEINPENEIGELKWLTLPEILKLDNLLSEFHEVLPLILDNTNKIISYTAVYQSDNELLDFQIEEPD